MPRWIGLGFQDNCSFIIRELSCLHDYIMVIIMFVLFLITYIVFYIIRNLRFYKYLSEGTFIETIWSIVPAVILVFLVLPSMKVLYIIEDFKNPRLTVKVVAHQWYWSYIVPLFNNISFFVSSKFYRFFEYDSMIDREFSLAPRLLGCSSDLVLPVRTSCRFLVTSGDVIHSFALPSLGIKVDALPGRINQIFLNSSRVGQYFGQCSEICGSNHSFIPISLKICGLNDYQEVSKSYLFEMLIEDKILLSFSF